MTNSELMEILGIADTIESNGGWHIAAVKLRGLVGDHKALSAENARLTAEVAKWKADDEVWMKTSLAEIVATNERLRAGFVKINELYDRYDGDDLTPYLMHEVADEIIAGATSQPGRSHE